MTRRSISESRDWPQLLPMLVQDLLSEAALQEGELQAAVAGRQAEYTRGYYNGRTDGTLRAASCLYNETLDDLTRELKGANARVAELAGQVESSAAEVQTLRQQLAEAAGREQALQGVIGRHMNSSA